MSYILLIKKHYRLLLSFWPTFLTLSMSLSGGFLHQQRLWSLRKTFVCFKGRGLSQRTSVTPSTAIWSRYFHNNNKKEEEKRFKILITKSNKKTINNISKKIKRLKSIKNEITYKSNNIQSFKKDFRQSLWI